MTTFGPWTMSFIGKFKLIWLKSPLLLPERKHAQFGNFTRLPERPHSRTTRLLHTQMMQLMWNVQTKLRLCLSHAQMM